MDGEGENKGRKGRKEKGAGNGAVVVFNGASDVGDRERLYSYIFCWGD